MVPLILAYRRRNSRHHITGTERFARAPWRSTKPGQARFLQIASRAGDNSRRGRLSTVAI
jgi:hypothetical protein